MPHIMEQSGRRKENLKRDNLTSSNNTVSKRLLGSSTTNTNDRSAEGIGNTNKSNKFVPRIEMCNHSGLWQILYEVNKMIIVVPFGHLHPLKSTVII